MLRQHLNRLLDVYVEQHGDLSVDHVRVVIRQFIFEVHHVLHVIQQVALVGEDHDYVVIHVAALLNLVDPTRHVLHIVLVRQVAHDYEAVLVPIKLLKRTLHKVALGVILIVHRAKEIMVKSGREEDLAEELRVIKTWRLGLTLAKW